ncbi:phage terminase small subunit [Pseudomonas sp. TE12234]
MALKSRGFLAVILSTISCVVMAEESTNDLQTFCTKISKYYQAAAQIREQGISEEAAVVYMDHIKNEDDRRSMVGAIAGAYEVYTAYDSEQIKVVSYRQCLIENKVAL